MSSTIKDIREFTRAIDGWLADIEGKQLYHLAKACEGKGVIVEIGSWQGKSTVWLGKGAQAGHHPSIYAIDPHQGNVIMNESNPTMSTLDTFNNNIRQAGLEQLVTPVVKTSVEAAKDFDRPIELIFIDGLHEYEHVKTDFEAWFPKVILGGIMAFHDTVGKAPGPRKLVDRYVYRSHSFKNVRFTGSITFAEKTTQNSWLDRLRNRYTLLLKTLYHNAVLLNFKINFPQFVITFGHRLIRLFQ